MGVNLKDLVIKRDVTFADMSGKVLAVDAYNMLYQFLANIRAPDGSLFCDSHGRVTSHLIGLLSRTLNFMDKGLKLAFVFDGKVPDLKAAELRRRRQIKEEAAKEYEKAAEREDTEAMRKFAARTSILSKDMVAQAKRLLDLLGQPVIQAPTEGEAQAARMVQNGDAWAVASQDYDALLYGSPRLIQNLSLAGKRKKTGTLGWVTVNPQLLDLEENLMHLGLSRTQLVALAMLVGTDFAPGGVKGIGPKKALALVKEHGEDRKTIFGVAEWRDSQETPWEDVFETITKMPTTDDYALKWKPVDAKGIIEFLSVEHDFQRTRLQTQLSDAIKSQSKQGQKGLGAFFS